MSAALAIRQFEEETSLRVHVILDGSGSMSYGSPGRPTKYEYACRVAAALGYIVSKQQDSLGLTIYDNEVRDMVPARSGTRHLQDSSSSSFRRIPAAGMVTDTGKALPCARGNAFAPRLDRPAHGLL